MVNGEWSEAELEVAEVLNDHVTIARHPWDDALPAPMFQISTDSGSPGNAHQVLTATRSPLWASKKCNRSGKTCNVIFEPGGGKR